MLKRKNEYGMSLTEIMVAVVVIGIISAIAVAGWSKYRQTAIEAQAKTEVNDIALEINDTKQRTMTTAGYNTTYAGIPTAKASEFYDKDSFTFKQYYYNTSKDITEITSFANSARYETICVQLSIKGKPESTNTWSSMIQNTASTNQLKKQACPSKIT